MTTDDITLLSALYAHLTDPTTTEHTEIDWSDIPDLDAFIDQCTTIPDYQSLYVQIQDLEFYVCTDGGADDLFHEYIESLLDDCILPEIPENYRFYFDSEKFEEDAKINDGRGSQISSYDGIEREILLDDIWYYIYHIN